MFISHYRRTALVYRKNGKIDVVSESTINGIGHTLIPVLRWNNEENCESTLKAYAEPGVPLEVVYFADYNSPFLRTGLIPEVEIQNSYPYHVWHRCSVCGRIFNDNKFENHDDTCALCRGKDSVPNSSWNYVTDYLREHAEEPAIYYNADGYQETKTKADIEMKIGWGMRPVVFRVFIDGKEDVGFADNRVELVPFILAGETCHDVLYVNIVPKRPLSFSYDLVNLGKGGYIDEDLNHKLDEESVGC